MNIFDLFERWLGRQEGSVGKPRDAHECPLACFLADTFKLKRISIGESGNSMKYRTSDNCLAFNPLPLWALEFIQLVDALPSVTKVLSGQALAILEEIRPAS